MCPGVFDDTVNAEAGNLWNTAATFKNIGGVGIVIDLTIAGGGVDAMEKLSMQKSNFTTVEE